MLSRDEIASLVPHHGDMLLIDSVREWSEGKIVCVSNQHRSADNPLRRGGILPAASGIEFCGQAMAIHGALVGVAKDRRGLLVALRDVRFAVQRLDLGEGELLIEATAIDRSADASSYGFCLSGAGKELLSGRAIVLFA